MCTVIIFTNYLIISATGAQDIVIRNPDGTISTRPRAAGGGGGILGGGAGPDIGGAVPAAGGRKKWGGHGTQVVSALKKVEISSETMTISKDEPGGRIF